jgi:hypothetical protein
MMADTKHTSTRFRGEHRRKGTQEKWHRVLIYAGVQLEGKPATAERIQASVENMQEAIHQWDAEGRYEWRIIARETTWHEWIER